MKCRGLVLFFLFGAVCVHTFFQSYSFLFFLKSDSISFSHSHRVSHTQIACCWRERSCYDPASMEREHIVDKLSPLLPQPLFFFFPIVSLSSSPKKCTLQTSHTTLFSLSLSFFFPHFFSSCSVCLLFFLFPLLSWTPGNSSSSSSSSRTVRWRFHGARQKGQSSLTKRERKKLGEEKSGSPVRLCGDCSVFEQVRENDNAPTVCLHFD